MAKASEQKQWYKQRRMFFIYGVLLLLIAYGLGSWAIDTGSYWGYLGCTSFLAISIKFLMVSAKKQ